MGKSKYEESVAVKLEQVEWWARDGLTEADIAGKLGIAVSTLSEYKKKHAEFSEALKKGKEVADYQVESALYENAMNGNITAQIFWLKNRKPSKWRDRPEAESNERDRLNELVKQIGEASKR